MQLKNPETSVVIFFSLHLQMVQLYWNFSWALREIVVAKLFLLRLPTFSFHVIEATGTKKA